MARVARRVVAIDIDDKLLDDARRRVGEAGLVAELPPYHYARYLCETAGSSASTLRRARSANRAACKVAAVSTSIAIA